MSDENASGMRAFFSADLAGSTKLKNRLNHQELLRRYTSRKHLVKSLKKCDAESLDDMRAILNNLNIGTDDYDWAQVVRRFYEDLCASFAQLPWKAMGDELIFSIPVNGRADLHSKTVAFLKAIRDMDGKLRNRRFPDSVSAVRIKGTAWVAGFPVRNRAIEIPTPHGETERVDYLGPEMDSGFRLGKCTRPGMLAISVEMAELLAEGNATFAPMAATIVGWEKLSGVWNDHMYPVIWVDFPTSMQTTPNHLASKFSEWEQAECRWCKAWASVGDTRPEISSLKDQLESLRKSLPASLGIVNPYIEGDDLETQEMPFDHKAISELLNQIRRLDPPKVIPEEDNLAGTAASVADDVQKVEGLISPN